LSGAGEPNHTKKAMESVDKRLVRRNPPLIQLLDPPFDKSDLNPGYIKGYVPGVRENGGQYTHAAIWAAMAFAKSGDVKHAWEVLSIINPLNHGSSREDIEIYKVEPYVVAADVYAVSPHSGRGGWTWYTGSAGLLYRLIIESLLGLRREVNKLYIEPCIPPDWTTYNVHYRYNETMYNITIMLSNETNGPTGITIDGSMLPERFLTLVNDRKEHLVIWSIPGS
jgi:cellobiose phosphorylase